MITKIIKKMKGSGIIETLFQVVLLIFRHVVSRVKVFILSIRGYQVASSVHIGRNAYLFESKKHAIRIGSNSELGFGVRIKAGFNGKIIIGKNVLIDDFSFVSAQELIEIGDESMIASHVYIVDFNHKYPLTQSKKNIANKNGYERKKISIGKHVWIGTHAVILPGVTIGDGAVIGAGTVVTKSISANAIAVGNPAKEIKKNEK